MKSYLVKTDGKWLEYTKIILFTKITHLETGGFVSGSIWMVLFIIKDGKRKTGHW
jgi:hypothetical protein